MSVLAVNVMDTETNRPVNRPESSLRIENSFNNIRLLALKNKLTKVQGARRAVSKRGAYDAKDEKNAKNAKKIALRA